MKTKTCRYCGKDFTNIDFPAQFCRMVTCGKIECMKLRRWDNLGILDKKTESNNGEL